MLSRLSFLPNDTLGEGVWDPRFCLLIWKCCVEGEAAGMAEGAPTLGLVSVWLLAFLWRVLLEFLEEGLLLLVCASAVLYVTGSFSPYPGDK